MAWLCISGFALDPNQPISQLYNTAWTAREGVDGAVFALAQTTDGYPRALAAVAVEVVSMMTLARGN
jgi:hypothetical protein